MVLITSILKTDQTCWGKNGVKQRGARSRLVDWIKHQSGRCEGMKALSVNCREEEGRYSRRHLELKRENMYWPSYILQKRRYMGVR